MTLNISFSGGKNSTVALIHFSLTSCVSDISLMIWSFKHLDVHNYMDYVPLLNVIQMLYIIFMFFSSVNVICTIVLKKSV